MAESTTAVNKQTEPATVQAAVPAAPDLDHQVQDWKAPIYYGEPHENARAWLDLIQAGCEQRSVTEDSYPAVSRRFLGDKPKSYIDKYERSLAEMSPDFKWNWKAFKIAIVAMTHSPSPEAAQATEEQHETALGEAWDETNKLIKDHPMAAKAAGVVLLAASAPILAPIASAGALSMLGIGSAGPIVGSLAASLESAAFGGIVGNNPLSVAQTAMGDKNSLMKIVQAMLTTVFDMLSRIFRFKGTTREITNTASPV